MGSSTKEESQLTNIKSFFFIFSLNEIFHHVLWTHFNEHSIFITLWLFSIYIYWPVKWKSWTFLNKSNPKAQLSEAAKNETYISNPTAFLRGRNVLLFICFVSFFTSWIVRIVLLLFCFCFFLGGGVFSFFVFVGFFFFVVCGRLRHLEKQAAIKTWKKTDKKNSREGDRNGKI